MVGYQIAAANIGGATLPALMGVAVGIVGLTVIPPLLVANAVILWGAIYALQRVSERSEDPLTTG